MARASLLLVLAACQQSACIRIADVKHDEYGLKCNPGKPIEKSDFGVRGLVTAMVFSSPRPQDATGLSLEVLKHVVCSIRYTLGLEHVRIIVAFDHVAPVIDGVTEAPRADTEADYRKKIGGLRDWNKKYLGSSLEIFVNPTWTHQAQMMEGVFNQLESEKAFTPLVFIAQDDSMVTGEIDVPFILQTLSCDPTVDYVRFLYSADCDANPNFNQPCTTHNGTARLQKSTRYSDRPHFATTKFYRDTVLPAIDVQNFSVPEQSGVPSADTMWMYGEHGHMHHDINVFKGSYNKIAGPYSEKYHDQHDAYERHKGVEGEMATSDEGSVPPQCPGLQSLGT